MSGQSFPQRPSGPYDSYLPNRANQAGFPSSHLLAQFTAANTPGYQPRPQIQTTTQSSASAVAPVSTSNTVATLQQTKSATKMSDFAASAYETALNPSKPFPLHPQPIDLTKFKGFRFVSNDAFQITTRDIYDKISGTYQWENCESQEDRCLKHIREECTEKRVFIVASGSLGKVVVPQIHDLPQVYAIYIHCADVNFHLGWSVNYRKVRVVCNDDDKYLLPQLAVDVAQSNIDWGNAFLKENKLDDAKKKFDKALVNLTEHVKSPDETMLNEIKSKLEACKK